ncbi:PIG-L family deacetylase [Streptomyces sp. NPDC040724]|uniref:PIG-L family deacetylase n=1 Tax=Streptomyces sp. NPDC040724 TaxID=3155612 RepID=UPI0033CB6C18
MSDGHPRPGWNGRPEAWPSPGGPEDDQTYQPYQTHQADPFQPHPAHPTHHSHQHPYALHQSEPGHAPYEAERAPAHDEPGHAYAPQQPHQPYPYQEPGPAQQAYPHHGSEPTRQAYPHRGPGPTQQADVHQGSGPTWQADLRHEAGPTQQADLHQGSGPTWQADLRHEAGPTQQADLHHGAGSAQQAYPHHGSEPTRQAHQAHWTHEAGQAYLPQAAEAHVYPPQGAQQAQHSHLPHQAGGPEAYGSQHAGVNRAYRPRQAQQGPQAHPYEGAEPARHGHVPHPAGEAGAHGPQQAQQAHPYHQAGPTQHAYRAEQNHPPHGAEAHGYPAHEAEAHAYPPHGAQQTHQAHPYPGAEQASHAYAPQQAEEAGAHGPQQTHQADLHHEAEPTPHVYPSPRAEQAPAHRQQQVPQGTPPRRADAAQEAPEAEVLEAEGPAGGRKAARLAREAEGTGGGGRRGRAKAPAAPQTARGRRRAGGKDGSGNGNGSGDGPGDGSGNGDGPGPEPAGGRAGRPNPRHRRARLVKAVALLAATAACGMLVLRGNEALDGLASTADPDSAASAPAAVADAPDPGRVLQVIAHPDDDLYFMNPDLHYSISAGHPVTSVYLTSGEADGINAGAAKEATTAPNKAAYAEARQNGIRAAYAKMATGDRSSAWKRTVVPTKGGGHAEVDVLVAKPQVNLVWLQLREAGHGYADVPESLHGLWDGKVARLDSMLASGTPVKQRFSYSKDQVVQSLVGVLEQYKPTTVRSQDPTPGRFPDTKRYTDHQDHFYGARFVQLATAAYAKDVKDRPHFAVQNYLGYFNGSLPSALDPDEAKEKLDILDTYAWLDRQNHCGSDAGCGDLKVADHPAGNRWSDSINYARGNSTTWLTSDKEHGLWAFKVLDGQVAVWHRPGLVGRWKGPDLLPGTGMDPGVGTVTLKDGRIAVFGTRTSFGAKPTDYKREVVHTVQKGSGSEEFGEWQSLGTPETADENWTSDISSPAVSIDGTGQPAVYVRDGAYTLRGRVQQADGSWGPWEKYGGADLHGTPATATDGAGRRMVFSATSKTVVGWVQPKPGAPLGPVTPTGLPDTTLPLTAEGREGGVRLWFRKPGSGNVRTALMTGDGGLKLNNMTDLGGLQGFGSVTASGHVLAGRSAGGQLGAEVGPGRPWERSPLMFVGAPSSVMTGKSMVSLAVVGLDARLYVTSSADAPDAYLAPWQPVGPRNTAP